MLHNSARPLRTLTLLSALALAPVGSSIRGCYQYQAAAVDYSLP